MNAPVDQPWSQAEQLDQMTGMTNADLDDLGNLFEFGDIDLNTISTGDANPFGDALHQAQSLSHPNTPFNGIGNVGAPPGTSAQDFGSLEQFGLPLDVGGQPDQYMLGSVSQPPPSHPFTSEAMYQPSMQQMYGQAPPQQYQYQPQHGFPPGHHVPPTPNSFDMHGEPGRFMQQQHQLDPQQRAMLEQRYQLRKDDAIAFTPMVSPAGTPQFHMQPDFAVQPGAYFSPLTSPMLHAQISQQAHQHHQGFYTNPSTAPSSNATSPIDFNLDAAPPEPATSQPKKSRRKATAPRSAGPSARVRQSPITKAQKRKSSSMLSAMVPVSEVDTIMTEMQRSANIQPGSAGLQIPLAFNTSSEEGSISPEPLSESLMGPPPRPGSSLNQSPALGVERQEDKSAATPKSLLSRKGVDSGQIDESGLGVGEAGGLDDLQLPEAAKPQPPRTAPKRIDTQMAQESESTEQTPRMSARKTPKLGPLSTPSSTRPASAMPSPSAVASPLSATTPGSLLKDKALDGKGSRANKKRGSVSGSTSNVASPALRPRISPSIKPLLPEGTALHSPTHALLLASKSNYQNLLEGNHLPGVTFPDSLSTGLTSKRTSHKVAEQGRRNRINDALKEMQALVPKEYLFGKAKGSNSDDSPEAGGPGDGEPDPRDSKEEAAAKSNSSKAATVESANVYMRSLQKKQAEEAAENERLRRRLEEMERRLNEQGRDSASASAGAAIGSSPDAAIPEVNAGDSPAAVRAE